MFRRMIVAMVLLASAGLMARDQGAQNVYVEANVGKLWTDDDRELSDAYMVGGGLGWRFHHHFSIQGGFAHLNDVSVTDRRADVDGEMLHVDFIANFGPYGDFLPFVSVGGGEFDFADTADFNDQSFVSVGVGSRYWLTEGVDMTLTGKYYYSSDESLDDLSLQVGLAYHFGGGKKKSERPLTVVSLDDLDSDGDGVPDIKDDCLHTPLGFKVGPNGCAQSFDDVESVGLDIKFKFDSSELVGDSRAALDEVAGFLKKHPDASVRVQGHTDSTGSSEYNLQLSIRRSKAAKTYLVKENGISHLRVNVEGFGEYQPIATNETAAGRQANRRTESNIKVVVRKPIE